MFPAPNSSRPSTLSGKNRARQRHIEDDCRARLSSLGDALSHLDSVTPNGVSGEEWGHLVADLKVSRVETLLRLDRATGQFPPPGSRVMAMLAEIKRLEGQLANLCSNYRVDLP